MRIPDHGLKRQRPTEKRLNIYDQIMNNLAKQINKSIQSVGHTLPKTSQNYFKVLIEPFIKTLDFRQDVTLS